MNSSLYDETTFLHQLESRALPESHFDHKAHLFAAWAYRRQYASQEAAARCARSLLRYVMVKDWPDKYHHTLTMALLVILYSRLESDPSLLQDWERFLAANHDVVCDPRAVVREHYSTARLNQDKARRAFVAPDLKPLPPAGQLH